MNTASSNATINQDIEEEMHRIKTDLKNVMNNVKEMKRLLKEGNGAIMNSSKTPSNEYMQSGYNKSNQQQSLSNESQSNAYRGNNNINNYDDGRKDLNNYEDGGELIDVGRDTKIKKLISYDNNECSKNDLSSKN